MYNLRDLLTPEDFLALQQLNTRAYRVLQPTVMRHIAARSRWSANSPAVIKKCIDKHRLLDYHEIYAPGPDKEIDVSRVRGRLGNELFRERVRDDDMVSFKVVNDVNNFITTRDGFRLPRLIGTVIYDFVSTRNSAVRVDRQERVDGLCWVQDLVSGIAYGVSFRISRF